MTHATAGTTPVERIAFQFVFDCVDRSGTRFAENKAVKQLKALGLKQAKPVAGTANGSSSNGSVAAAAAAPPKSAAKAKSKGGKKGKK